MNLDNALLSLCSTRPLPPYIQYMWWYHLFGLLWGSQFLLACQQCAIAGAVAAWFFARDKSQLNWPIMKSVQRIIRLAFCFIEGL